MSIQTITRPINLHTIEFSIAPDNSTCIEPVKASSRDYGFDFDDDALARELLAPIPVSNNDPLDQIVGADEFESLYKWFSS